MKTQSKGMGLESAHGQTRSWWCWEGENRQVPAWIRAMQWTTRKTSEPNQRQVSLQDARVLNIAARSQSAICQPQQYGAQVARVHRSTGQCLQWLLSLYLLIEQKLLPSFLPLTELVSSPWVKDVCYYALQLQQKMFTEINFWKYFFILCPWKSNSGLMYAR